MAGGFRGNLTYRPLQFIPTQVSTFLTVSTAPVTIPNTWIPNGMSSAWLCCDTLSGGIKMTFDGTPSINYGIDIGPGQMLEIRDNIDLLRRASFIRVTGTDGKLTIIPFTE